MQRGLSTLIAWVILTGSGFASPVSAADARWAGYLLDRSCAENCVNQGFGVDFASTHKKECALNESCSKAGYSILSKGQWFQLDKKGTEIAKKLLEKSKSDEGHFVVVTGVLNKNATQKGTEAASKKDAASNKSEIAVSTMREVEHQ